MNLWRNKFGPIDKNYRTFHPGSEKTHPGSRGQKGTGSRIRICNTVFIFNYWTQSSWTAWLTVHHPICSFFSNKIFSLCDFKKRCTSTVSNKNRIDFLLFIISSMLLLSFLSTPRYERERKSAFYYFFCVVAFFSIFATVQAKESFFYIISIFRIS